jgi:hypothetical protein
MLVIFAKTQEEYRINDAIILAYQPLHLTYNNMAVIRTLVVGTTLATSNV